MRYTCKIPLNDIINDELERDVVKTLRLISESTNQQIFINFWVSPATVQSAVEQFVDRYRDDLEFIGVNIHRGFDEEWHKKSIFEIRSIRDKRPNQHRHFYVYASIDQLIAGIFVFKRFVEESIAKDKGKNVSNTVVEKHVVTRPHKKDKYKVTFRRIDNDKE